MHGTIQYSETILTFNHVNRIHPTGSVNNNMNNTCYVVHVRVCLFLCEFFFKRHRSIIMRIEECVSLPDVRACGNGLS